MKGWKIVRSSFAARSCRRILVREGDGEGPLAGEGKTNYEVWGLGCGVAEIGDENLCEHLTNHAAFYDVVGRDGCREGRHAAGCVYWLGEVWQCINLRIH